MTSLLQGDLRETSVPRFLILLHLHNPNAPKGAAAVATTKKLKPSPAAPSTQKRKQVQKVVSIETRPFIDHLVINPQFLRDHALARVGELLENQGWSHLFLENYTLNKELTRQFFSTLVLSDADSSTIGTFTIDVIDIFMF